MKGANERTGTLGPPEVPVVVRAEPGLRPDPPKHGHLAGARGPDLDRRVEQSRRSGCGKALRPQVPASPPSSHIPLPCSTPACRSHVALKAEVDPTVPGGLLVQGTGRSPYLSVALVSMLFSGLLQRRFGQNSKSLPYIPESCPFDHPPIHSPIICLYPFITHPSLIHHLSIYLFIHLSSIYPFSIHPPSSIHLSTIHSSSFTVIPSSSLTIHLIDSIRAPANEPGALLAPRATGFPRPESCCRGPLGC